MTKRLDIRALATRERLLRAAGPMFADSGYAGTSVRDICRAARANVAAVNYHFGNKLGLYEGVISRLADSMASGKLDLIPQDSKLNPEAQLRAYIHNFLNALLAGRKDDWMDRLLVREMADPSPAIDLIIERGIRPNAIRLGGLVAKLLGAASLDDRVWRCTVGIQAQCLFYYSSRPVFLRMSPGIEFNAEFIEKTARHIAEFSLAGIRYLAQQKL